ncbi:DUF3782 domain-containing protein [Desulfococcaceae bacterium HSG8]|nr:DUF3782 domain-containing protein [Desulfococcaceae bacterium HSG8]
MEPQALEQIKNYIFEQLPVVLDKDPRFVVMIEGIVAEKFPRRDEFARLLDELRDLRISSEARWNELRSEMNRRFEQVDQRFEQVDQRFEQVDQRFEQVDQRFEQVDQRFEQVDQRFERMENKIKAGFRDVHVHIDRLGSRWGILNEKIFRQTMKEVIEGSLGMTVRECFIGGEQFDCVISNGQHILIEIMASVKANIQDRLIRKRQLYIDETGVTPSRFLVAVGSIHSRRAESLRAAGFEVVEPEE